MAMIGNHYLSCVHIAFYIVRDSNKIVSVFQFSGLNIFCDEDHSALT